jgi:hypothetical protein
MRTASCRCGKLQARCAGEPVRVSVCHCFECQRRTGSAFSAQARFPAENVALDGESRQFVRTADSGNKLTYLFCPACGSTIVYSIDAWPDLVAVPLGAFAGSDLPAPVYSVYENRKHPWVDIVGEKVEHHD